MPIASARKEKKGNRVPKEEFIPKWIAWEVTGRCNLNCIHCRSASSMSSFDSDFTTAEARKLIDDITSFCSPVLVLSGGEPLLRQDLFEIAKYGTDKGLRMCIATNGTLVTPDVADHLDRWRPFSVEITLYGRTRKTYERITGVTGSYERCLRGIHLLRDRGVPLKLKTPVVTLNVEELREILNFAEQELGLPFLFDPMISPRRNCSRAMPSELPPRRISTPRPAILVAIVTAPGRPA